MKNLWALDTDTKRIATYGELWGSSFLPIYDVWYYWSSNPCVYTFSTPWQIEVDAQDWWINVQVTWIASWDKYLVRKTDWSCNPVYLSPTNSTVWYWDLVQTRDVRASSYTLTQVNWSYQVIITAWNTDWQFQTELITADKFSSWWKIKFYWTGLTDLTIQWAEIFDSVWNNLWAVWSVVVWWVVEIDLNWVTSLSTISLLIYMAVDWATNPVITDMKVSWNRSSALSYPILKQWDSILVQYDWFQFHIINNDLASNNIPQQNHIWHKDTQFTVPWSWSTLSNVGQTMAIAWTFAHPAITDTNLKTRTRRTTIATLWTAWFIASVRPVYQDCSRNSWFYLSTTFSFDTIIANNRFFIWLTDTAPTTPTNIDPTTNTTPWKIWIAINTNTWNLKIVRNITWTAPTIIDLWVSFPVNNTNVYELVLQCNQWWSVVSYRVTNKTTWVIISWSFSTNIPAIWTALWRTAWITNNATASIVWFSLMWMYQEV